MGRIEPGDSHPIIKKWGGAWAVPKAGEGCPSARAWSVSNIMFLYKSQTCPNSALPHYDIEDQFMQTRFPLILAFFSSFR
jgi:hypothetical protein